MSTTDDLRAIRDLAENISTDLAGIVFRLGGVIERGTDRRAVLAEMTRDETADGFPGATSSALGDALRRCADWLREQAGYNAPADDVAGFDDRADALTAEAENLRTTVEYDKRVLDEYAENLDGHEREIVRLTAERDRLRDDYDRTAEAADRAAVRLREARNLADLAVTERDAAEAAVGRVRALLDGRAMVPVGLLAEALDGVQEARGSILTAPAGAEAPGEGRGAKRGAEGQESGSGPSDEQPADCSWSDYRRLQHDLGGLPR